MKLAIAGCCGRMGLTLIKASLADDRFELEAGSERPGFNITETQTQLASEGCPNLFVTEDPDELVKQADVVIDFTSPESTLVIAEAVAKKGKAHIIGTTGFSAEQQKQLEKYASKARIVQSGNFSLGVNVVETIVEQVARALDKNYDIEIFEMHHRYKKDAPSGTALMLGKAAAKGRGVSFDEKKVLSREGMTGERGTGDIGFSVQRGGDVVGIHNVMFAGVGELVEIRHQGFSREIYANGALHAALWVKDKKPGLYSMKHVLGIA